MTLLKIFALEDIKEEDLVSSLAEGEHVIGRGGSLNCNDKRISRRHALINVCKDVVTIKAVHVNPCFFKAADGNSITILAKDTSVELTDGDQFALLADQFWFKVRVVIDKDEEDAVNCVDLKNLEVGISDNTSAVNGSKAEITNLDTSTTSNSLPTGKRCQEDTLADTCKRQKISVDNENEPTTSTSSDKNVSYENASSTPSSPINSLDLLLDTSSNLAQNIGSNQLIYNLNNIMEEDFAGILISKEKLSNEAIKKQAVSDDDDDDESVDNSKINNNVTQMKNEKKDGNSEIKKENIPDSESKDDTTNKTEEKDIDKAETTNSSKLPIDKIKNENVEETCESKVEEDTESANKNSKNDQNEASCSKDNPKDSQSKKKSRRERCWYAHTCYRKNPLHLANFSHPGDDDFLSDPDDDRPICPFGDACYRTNLAHRRDYKHTSRPAPKPNDGRGKPKKRKSPKKKANPDDGDSSDDQNDDGTKKKRKAAMKKLYADYDSADDDYDYNDPFIDDASSDEFQLSSDDDDEDSTDWDDSQKVDEESQETRRLLKEAKRFTKKKKD